MEQKITENNPSMGWYRIFSFILGQKMDWDYISTSIVPKERLALVEISLEAYRSCSLDEDGLMQIEEILQFFADHSRDVILRMVYDMEGKGMEKEPTSITTIIRHMEDVGTIVRTYSDKVYMTQGLFIGSWGEMHSSKYLMPEQIRRLYQVWRNAIGENIYIALRTPAQLRMLLDAKTIEQLPKLQQMHKLPAVALYNDAILSSATDMGTYGMKLRMEASWEEPWCRADELAFQEEICRYIPNGGEAVGLAYTHEAGAVINQLRRMHISYLNSQYEEAVLKQWEQLPWEDTNVRDYVDAHMGCHMVWKKTMVRRRGKHLTLLIENMGLSNLYEAAEVRVCLEWSGDSAIDADHIPRWEYIIDTDPRKWNPQQEVTLDVDVSKAGTRKLHHELDGGKPSADKMPPGTYKISLVISRKSDGATITVISDKELVDTFRYR